MALSTPHGLKVRVDVPYAFGLMARLFPKVTPFKVLRTTEGIDDIPPALATLAAAVAVATGLEPIWVAGATLAGCVVGTLINQFGLYFVPGPVALGTLFASLHIFGIPIPFIALVVYVSIKAGLFTLLAIIAARILGGVIRLVFDAMFARSAFAAIGHPLTASERSFFNAYRIHAARLGVSTDLDLTETEKEPAHWRPCYEHLATGWPVMVARFSM